MQRQVPQRAPIGGELELEAVALAVQVRGRGHAVADHDRVVVAQLRALVHAQARLVHLVALLVGPVPTCVPSARLSSVLASILPLLLLLFFLLW
jgi:uncharacterized membrane protein